MKQKSQFLILFLLVSVCAFAQTFDVGNLTYTVTSGTNVSIGRSDTANPTGVLDIPATITNGGTTYAVTSIRPYGFYSCSGLTSVSIPNSINSIPVGAFYLCSGITSVTIPNTVALIGTSAFQQCSALTSVTIPNSVTSLGLQSFGFCSALTSVTIPDSVTLIGNYVFRNCPSLTSVTFSNSLTNIPEGMFSNCTGLSTVNIPATVTSIGTSAFGSCTGLTSVTVNWSNPLVISATVFSAVNTSAIPLFVPAGTEALYEANSVWTDFGTINAQPPSCTTPTITATTPTSRCGVGAATLSATASNGEVVWYATETGGSPLTNGIDYTIDVNNNLTINNLTATTTFYAEAVDGDCVSTTRTAVTATVTTTPSPSPAIANLNVVITSNCSGFSGTYNYSGLFNGKGSFSLATNPIFKIAFDGTNWVFWNSNLPIANSGFQNTTVPEGLFPPVNGWVPTGCGNGTLTATSNSNFVSCQGTTLAAISLQGQNLQWYDAATNGNSLPTSTILTSGTYYVTQTINGCESPRTAITVTVNTTPTPTASAQLFCGSATVAQLQATGTNLKWYNSMGSLLTPSTVLSSGTYFVSQTVNGCESAQTEVLVTINPIPNAPTASDQTFCGTTTVANLQATGENLKWYGVATSGYALSASTVINMTGIYYVSQTVNGCESARIPVLVTNLLPNVPTPIQTVAITPSSFNVDVIVEGSESPYVSSLGTFDGFSARLVASSYSYNNTVVTNSLPDSGFFTSVANTQISYQLQSNKTLNAIQIRNFNETKTATFSSPTLATKLFVLASTGNGNATAEITVNYADGTSEVFSRQISDWYNGTGFAIQGIARVNIFEYQNPFNNPRLYEIELNLQNASPVTSVTFKKTTNNSSALINIMAISAQSTIPTTYCENQTLSDIALPLATGATANFYASAQGGEALSNSSLVASGTYYVSQSINGCESARTAVSITVIPAVTYYADADNDGFGNPEVTSQSCAGAPMGYVALNTDCNDNNAAINPNAVDVCYDGIDNNCDGIIDNGCTPIVSVLQPSLCGGTLPAINSYIYANLVAGAQGYRFRVTDMTTMQVQTIDKALRVFTLTQLPSYAFDRTYQVEVAIRYNNVWQPFYGLPCTVTTPVATTKVQPAQCGANFTNLNTPIMANPVAFATGYRFKITDLSTMEEQIIDRPIRDFRLSNVAFATTNKDYSIAVAVRNTNGVYMPYGEACNVSTYSDITITKLAQESSSKELIAVAYPNPFSNSFGISLENYSQEQVEINVYSMLGTLVEAKQVDSNSIHEVSLGNAYPSGVYNVIVAQGSNVKTLRIVKR